MKAMNKNTKVLECEKLWVFMTLMCIGGFLGGFTYSVRGGVFCNAQTANIVLFGMSLGQGHLNSALYYLIPISAYFLGAVISEAIAKPIKKLNLIRWDTLFVLIEMAAIIFLGLLPESAPYQITQITINFICSMQYNTFRKTKDIPMATTFCTNHLRQVGVAFSKALVHKDKAYLKRMFLHLGMLAVFSFGAAAAAFLSSRFYGKAIFAALIPLSVVSIKLLYADLKTEKNQLDKIPQGH